MISSKANTRTVHAPAHIPALHVVFIRMLALCLPSWFTPCLCAAFDYDSQTVNTETESCEGGYTVDAYIHP